MPLVGKSAVLKLVADFQAKKNMSSINLQIEEMACEFVFTSIIKIYFHVFIRNRGCISSVTTELKKFAGVADVKVNLETKTATISLNDAKKFPLQQALAKLNEIGYPAKKLE